MLDIQNRSQVEEAVICIAYNPQNREYISAGLILLSVLVPTYMKPRVSFRKLRMRGRSRQF